MLKFIECDQFAETVDGKKKPRGRITFHEGLNVVLGDEKASNSIGKSTFLLAIDFCFGGKDYINGDICKAVENIGNHIIKFGFYFDNHEEWYSRSTNDENHVKQYKSADFNEVLKELSIKEFWEHLHDAYDLPKDISWREMVSTFARIALRDNYDPQLPMKIRGRSNDKDIDNLIKVFNRFDKIQEYKKEFDEVSEKLNHYDALKNDENIKIITTKKAVKNNKEEIKELQKKLEELTNKEDVELSDEKLKRISESSELSKSIKKLRREYEKIENRINLIELNKQGKLEPDENDFAQLKYYFPNVNEERLKKVENFHQKLTVILKNEFDEEQQSLKEQQKVLSETINQYEEEARELNTPVNIPVEVIDEISDLKSKIIRLMDANSTYDNYSKLREEKNDSKKSFVEVKKEQGKAISSQINKKMSEINHQIYGDEKNPPFLTIDQTKQNKSTYQLSCVSDIGTGQSNKNLIIFDLSLLSLTQLPYVEHDSVLLKEIEDLSVDKLVSLYASYQKQIFLAIDKIGSYNEKTEETLNEHAVLKLHANGGELFGKTTLKDSV